MSNFLRVLSALFALLLALNEANAVPPKRVLLLHSFGRDFSPWSEVSRNFQADLVGQYPRQVDIYEASLLEGEPWLIEYVQDLFADNAVDLTVTIGPTAAQFVGKHRADLFDATPILFAGVDQRTIPKDRLGPNEAVVGISIDTDVFIENILSVLPDTKEILVVIGDSPLENYWVSEMRRDFEKFADRVNITWTNDLSLDEIVQRVGELGPHTAIFYTMLVIDGAGIPQALDRALAPIIEAAHAPVFGLADFQFGRGIVGGPLVQVSRSGRQVAEIAIRVLEGENPGNVGLPTLGSGPLRFDWRALQRWGISEAQLPKNSVIEFQEPSAWQQYRWQIILIVMAMLVQTSLIISLLYERRRRRGAEAESRERLRELAYMNRRAGAGELSATIAHEINQPLAAIVASAAAALRWLAKDTPNVGEATTALNRIAADGHRASDIIKAVRAMFHKDARERQRSDINELIEDVIGLLRTELSRHSISVRLDLARGIPPVNVNRTEIQQVVLNLTMNAIEAMAATKDRSRYLVFRSSENALGEVVVDIEDSGPGIDPAVIGRVFDPFFSTKPDGTGMGLAICRSIVEAHGGKLTVAPGYPHGAVFTISLPREDGTGQ